MNSLPRIMVAPNGARLTKADHPNVPVTIEELVTTARRCFAAGAGAIHAHVRDENQHHVLDAGLYQELISEMSLEVPQMAVQITTEAAGRYSPEQQRSLVKKVIPKAVSISLAEMLSDNNAASARSFYHWCHEAAIAVQHILYSPSELRNFIHQEKQKLFPAKKHQLLFVLGRYSEQQSDPTHLDNFIKLLNQSGLDADWAVCAFGPNETICAAHALKLDGKCRIGFENSIYHANGEIAASNAERIEEVISVSTQAADATTLSM